MQKGINIVYFGTPEFAVAPLNELLNNRYNISAVVTSPDKPCGRGLKLGESAVKKYALKKGLRIIQPENLKSPDFIEQIKEINPNLMIVVAFRMLPESLWKLPSLGTFNLHASLLPQYRGAAPINWAIINGEKTTGLTTFFIEKEIDMGKIIYFEEISIGLHYNAGILHDILMKSGAKLLLKTVKSIESRQYSVVKQDEIKASQSELKNAPKIYKETCIVNWNNKTEKIYNHIRGLSPFPAAISEILSPDGTPYYIKVYRCKKEIQNHLLAVGNILTDSKTHISIAVADGFILLQEIQLSGKKKMLVDEFLRGFPMNAQWKMKLA